jgi:hypothetical protein
LNERLLLWQEVENGFFVRTTDEEMLDELKLFIENLDCAARFASDHVWNLLPEIEGKLPEAKAKMLDVIARFQSLSPAERQIYRVGRRAHYYNSLDDLKDPAVHQVVEQLINELSRGTGTVDENILFDMRETQ